MKWKCFNKVEHLKLCVLSKKIIWFAKDKLNDNEMSRRASVYARNNPGKRRVRFPDEVIFENEIKEQDGTAVMAMLRRASIDIDLNRINMAGKQKPSSFLNSFHWWIYMSSSIYLTFKKLFFQKKKKFQHQTYFWRH